MCVILSEAKNLLLQQFQIWFGNKPPSRPPPASADALQGGTLRFTNMCSRWASPSPEHERSEYRGRVGVGAKGGREG